MRRLLLMLPFASLVSPGHSAHAQYYPTSRLLCTRLLSAAELLPATTAAATVVLFSAALPGALLLRCAALQQFGELRHAG